MPCTRVSRTQDAMVVGCDVCRYDIPGDADYGSPGTSFLEVSPHVPRPGQELALCTYTIHISKELREDAPALGISRASAIRCVGVQVWLLLRCGMPCAWTLPGHCGHIGPMEAPLNVAASPVLPARAHASRCAGATTNLHAEYACCYHDKTTRALCLGARASALTLSTRARRLKAIAGVRSSSTTAS